MADPTMAPQPSSQPTVIASTTQPLTGPPGMAAEDLHSAAGLPRVPWTPSVAPKTLPATARPKEHDEASTIDLGWGAEPKDIGPLVSGISNEDFWLLVRRMNNVVFHLKDSPRVALGSLDFAVDPEQEFSPNKMRSQMERLYMSVIISALAFVKHVSRLRSWNEKTRTGAFCTAYFALWVFDFLTLGTTVFLLALVMSPSVRNVLFPPAPVALVDTLSGNLTKPNSGVLASQDSVTGAPENFKGEAVENEASNFVTAFSAIAVNIMSGVDPQGEPNPPDQDLHGPMRAGPDELATMVASAKDKAKGIDRPSQDKSKAPMETIMWSKVKPAMQIMTTICDLAEKITNALNPKPPFHPSPQRHRLASLIAPLVAASLFLSRDIVFRGAAFLVGLLFFGDPVLKKSYHWLNQKHPDWIEDFTINNILLRGVPTNQQLALALLRQGEKKKAPLPPPPRLHQSPPQVQLALTSDVISAVGGDQPLGASNLELAEAAAPDRSILDDAGGDDVEATKSSGSKEPHKFLQIIKGAAKASVKGAVAFDRTRAAFGHEGAKNRVGVIPGKHHDAVIGPCEFDARYKGLKGFLHIDSSAAQPLLTFNRQSAKKLEKGVADPLELRPVWSLPIQDIQELRKHTGYGFKSKLAAGWALDKELNDSVGISDRLGNDWAVTAIPNRDALFNRLIAISDQRWEIC